MKKKPLYFAPLRGPWYIDFFENHSVMGWVLFVIVYITLLFVFINIDFKKEYYHPRGGGYVQKTKIRGLGLMLDKYTWYKYRDGEWFECVGGDSTLYFFSEYGQRFDCDKGEWVLYLKKMIREN